MRNTIERGFRWIADALKPQSGQSPNELIETTIQTVLDAAQGGWGHSDTRVVPFDYPVQNSATTPIVVDLETGLDVTLPNAPTPSEAWQFIVLSLSVHGLANVVTGDAWLQYRAGPAGAAVVHSCVTVGATLESLAAEEIFSSPLAASRAFLPDGPLRVPAGYRPQLCLFTYDTVRVRGAVAIMRAGYAGRV